MVVDSSSVDTDRKRALEEAEAQAPPPPCCRCGKTEVKYRCPRCERFDCNGKRDRTKFVGIKGFTDADLSSGSCLPPILPVHFFFLEEVSRSTNSATRSRSQLGANTRRYTSNKKRKVVASKHSAAAPINPDIPADWLARFPIAVQLFAEHAAKRGVALTLLAPGMSKRGRNSSFMDTKKNSLFWRVEWAFPSAEVPVNLSENRANEADSLFALLGRHLTPSQWEKHVVLLLRKEFTPASQPQYYRLDGTRGLESNLKRKAIVEFPVITVALLSEADQYPVAYDVIETVSSEEAQGVGTAAGEEEEAQGMEVESSSSAEPSADVGDATGPAATLFNIAEEVADSRASPEPMPEAKESAGDGSAFELCATVAEHSAPICCVESTRDGSLLASSDMSGVILVHSPDEGFEVVHRIEGDGYPATCMAFVADNWLVGGYLTGCIRLFSPDKFHLHAEIAAHTRAITALDARDAHVVSVSEDTFMNIWEILPGKAAAGPRLKLVSSQPVPNDLLTGVAFSSANTLFTATYDTAHVKLWTPE
ncbi:hypothetical protein BBJ28_00013896 [Nothophytophthora sp. Chile5]|nr:hypothetical protein BBJ28_00013896 [Nothophytophthora sp. Chile5]